MQDVRDALAWVQEGGLALALEMNDVKLGVDAERVLAMGTSSGGCLALSLVGYAAGASCKCRRELVRVGMVMVGDGG